MTNANNIEPPEGVEFLKLTRKQENQCEAETDSRIPDMGTKAPAAFEGIGTVLSLLDRMASCFWRCGGGDHDIEYLCGRASSNGRAAMRLLRMGFYDESLVLSRNIGEIANLLFLFRMEGSALEEWQESGKRLSPGEVRRRLAGLTKLTPPIDGKRYGTLSERTVHPDSGLKPQAFNLLGAPSTASIFQEWGLFVTLNELALPLAYSCLAGGLLLDLDDEVKERITAKAEDLLEQFGAIDLSEFEKIYSAAMADPKTRNELLRQRQEWMQLQSEMGDFWQARTTPRKPLGQWLVENMPRGINLEIPDRQASERPIPFADEESR